MMKSEILTGTTTDEVNGQVNELFTRLKLSPEQIVAVRFSGMVVQELPSYSAMVVFTE